jgi:hypothetical protein
MASSADLVTVAVQRFQRQVPTLANLKLVVGLELTAGGLAGGEPERFRVQVPGPKVTGGPGDDERLVLRIPKAMFGVLAEEAELADWREAYFYGHLQVEGDDRVKRLLGRSIGGP